MNVDVTKLPESRVALRIEMTADEVGQALERTYRQLVQRVSIPGFRKGKAPRAVVERAVGHEVFLHEATDEAVRWGYRQAIDQENLTPIDQADIAPSADGHGHVEPGEPFQFEATVAVKPEVRLPELDSLTVERPDVQVSDQDVSELLEEIRSRNATLEPTIQAAGIGDVVTMNVTGKVAGEEVVNAEEFDFELTNEEESGPDQRFPGLAAELVGANRGDIRDVALPLPETYLEAELAGQTLFLRILVKEIKRKVLPALDDELAQSVSKFETLDELRAALRSNLEVERNIAADEQLVADAIEAVSSRTFVEIPPVMVDEEIDRMLDDLGNAFEQRHLSFQMFLQQSGKTEEQLRDEMREQAISNVKTSLVIGAVADAEHIEISPDEVSETLEEIMRTGELPNAERRRLRASAAARSNVRNRLRRQRAIQRLVAIVTGGKEVAPEAAETMADESAVTTDDTEETVPLEIGG